MCAKGSKYISMWVMIKQHRLVCFYHLQMTLLHNLCKYHLLVMKDVSRNNTKVWNLLKHTDLFCSIPLFLFAFYESSFSFTTNFLTCSLDWLLCLWTLNKCMENGEFILSIIHFFLYFQNSHSITWFYSTNLAKRHKRYTVEVYTRM